MEVIITSPKNTMLPIVSHVCIFIPGSSKTEKNVRPLKNSAALDCSIYCYVLTC